jgi:two-component system cell cycle response regulator
VTVDPALARVQELEDMTRRDAAAAFDAARAWLAEAGPDVDPVLRQRVRLVRADGQARQGQPETSVLVMREINSWATEHDVPWLRARSHRLLSARFRRAGDGALALEHAVAAVDLLPDDARAVVRADHLLCLADALGEVGSFEQSLRRYDEAGAIAQASGDVEMWLHVLNNVAYTHFGAGNATEAVATAERLQQVADRHGIELDVYDRDTIARAYTMVGRHEDAVAVLLPVVGSTAPPSRSPVYDGVATGLLTLAEIQRLAGSLADAQSTLDRAVAICEENHLTGLGIDAQREQAEIHAANGLFEDAFRTFKAFHHAATELRAVERETRARTLQAIYEADEARRDSDRFRELSVRDPLTGLRNRRYVDEHLGGQLLHAVDSASPLTLAILDLDHFKVVNDERSHDVGDQVLREVAVLIDEAVAGRPAAMTARLGGEEFLVVLPDLEPASAVDVLERLCRRIREHDWFDITAGIPVTTSIGVASAPADGVDRTPLLASADRRLYAAKKAGRDRVVAGDAPLRELQPAG